LKKRPYRFSSLDQLNSRVVSCDLCPRLRRYCRRVARLKRKQFLDWDYWGRPLPGFGDPDARLLILGLAPAAHGGNRTGRMFTGDGSAKFLMAALHRHGFANQPTSYSRDDGLKLRDAYMTAVVRCAPPGNKPRPSETANCSRYWTQELNLLGRLRVVLALGRVAFDTYVKYLGSSGVPTNGLEFGHGRFYVLQSSIPSVCASYHPSRQNTQTGKLTEKMFDNVLLLIRRYLDRGTGQKAL